MTMTMILPTMTAVVPSMVSLELAFNLCRLYTLIKFGPENLKHFRGKDSKKI